MDEIECRLRQRLAGNVVLADLKIRVMESIQEP
jgi:hypothetical protein